MKLLVPADPSTQKGNNFDALRLFLAVGVVWSHSFALLSGHEEGEPLGLALNELYNAGGLCVMGFFIISGYLIAGSYVRAKSAVDFMVKRIRRIHPGYLVATFIAAFVIAPAFDPRGFGILNGREVLKVVALNLLLKNYVPPTTAFASNPSDVINGSLWSIPFEFCCYIGILALGLSRLLRRRLLVLLGAVLVEVIFIGPILLGRKASGGWLLSSFLIGTLVYLYRDRLPRSRWLLLAAIILPPACAHLPLSNNGLLALSRLIVPLSLSYAIFHVAFSTTVRLYGCARYGDFSYGTYLYAFPIQQIIVTWFAPPLVLFVPVSMLLSVLAGALSWFSVERWFLPPSRRRHTALPGIAPKLATPE